MLRALLQITGIEQRLQALKLDIETKAEGFVLHGKAMAMRLAVAVALATAAVAILLLAFIAGLIALYLALEPRLGSLGATGVVGGALVVVGAMLAVMSLIVARKRGPSAEQAIAEVRATKAKTRAALVGEGIAASADPILDPAPPVTPTEAEAILSLARRYTRAPVTGITPLDEILRILMPRAEEASKEALARAANLMRHGDRSTMLTILGAAAAAGWLFTRAHRPEPRVVDSNS